MLRLVDCIFSIPPGELDDYLLAPLFLVNRRWLIETSECVIHIACAVSTILSVQFSPSHFTKPKSRQSLLLYCLMFSNLHSIRRHVSESTFVPAGRGSGSARVGGPFIF